MSVPNIGPLLSADESLHHQIVDTMAVVAQSEYSWTEKIWVSIARTDGSLQLDFGLGKYPNRGVIDGFGGVSRGHEQWTVRASRALHSAPETTEIGTVHYEVIEPLKQIRVRLEPNDVQPISFDVVLSAVTPPFLEERNRMVNTTTHRIDMDVVRYHQGGWATGTITVDGETQELNPNEWFGFRDHSWGVRPSIGTPLTDLMPPERPTSKQYMMKWNPAFLQRPDGSYYETHAFINLGAWDYVSAYINDSDGSQVRARSVHPNFRYDPRTRFVQGGELRFVMESGEERVLEVETLGSSGFFLRTSGYGSWKGHIHGAWQGELAIDGDYIADCWDDEHLRQLGQFRDTPVRVREGDAIGYGILESMIYGGWPEFGLGS